MGERQAVTGRRDLRSYRGPSDDQLTSPQMPSSRVSSMLIQPAAGALAPCSFRSIAWSASPPARRRGWWHQGLPVIRRRVVRGQSQRSPAQAFRKGARRAKRRAGRIPGSDFVIGQMLRLVRYERCQSCRSALNWRTLRCGLLYCHARTPTFLVEVWMTSRRAAISRLLSRLDMPGTSRCRPPCLSQSHAVTSAPRVITLGAASLRKNRSLDTSGRSVH